MMTAPAQPTLTLTTDTATAGDGITSEAEFALTAEAGSTVTLLADGEVVATATPSLIPGGYTADLSAVLEDGTYQITAVATDLAGNASPAATPVALTLDTAAPANPTLNTVAGDGTVSAAEAADLGAHKAKAFGELSLEKARLLHEAQPALEAPVEAFRRAQEALVEATSRWDDAEVQAAVHDVARRQLLARVERQIALTEVSVLTALPGRRDLVRAVLATDSRRRRRPSPPAEAADVASGNDG